jgi:hypothetical protein
MRIFRGDRCRLLGPGEGRICVAPRQSDPRQPCEHIGERRVIPVDALFEDLGCGDQQRFGVEISPRVDIAQRQRGHRLRGTGRPAAERAERDFEGASAQFAGLGQLAIPEPLLRQRLEEGKQVRAVRALALFHRGDCACQVVCGSRDAGAAAHRQQYEGEQPGFHAAVLTAMPQPRQAVRSARAKAVLDHYRLRSDACGNSRFRRV